MSGIVRQAFFVTFSRFANQALAFISPVILVRLLTVEQFGSYRQFLLFLTTLIPCAGLAINNSLLYFLGAHPDKVRGLVRQSTAMVCVSSVACLLLVFLIDVVTRGELLGTLLWPTLLCVFFMVNVDFWEFLWLAQKQVTRVFAYSTGRLLARMGVVLVAASVTHDVHLIVWAVVVTEGLRLLFAVLAWLRYYRSKEVLSDDAGWRAQARFCAPVAFGTVLGTFSRQAGELFVISVLNSVALAQYAIGAYVQYVVAIVRNSISDVLLPVMARAEVDNPRQALAIWKNATIIFAMLLLPVGALLARYAEPIIITLFSDKYRASVPIFQLYALILVRECFDLDLLVRAINRTEVLIRSNIISIVTNLILLFVLVPWIGITGAVVAMLVARTLEAVFLGYCAVNILSISLRRLLPIVEMIQILIAVGLASLVLIADWQGMLGLPGVVLSAVLFVGAYALGLRLLNVHAIESITQLIAARRAGQRARA